MQLTVLLSHMSSTTSATPFFTFDGSPFCALQVPQYYRRSECAKYLIYSSGMHISCSTIDTYRVFHVVVISQRHGQVWLLVQGAKLHIDASHMLNPRLYL